MEQNKNSKTPVVNDFQFCVSPKMNSANVHILTKLNVNVWIDSFSFHFFALLSYDL